MSPLLRGLIALLLLGAVGGVVLMVAGPGAKVEMPPRPDSFQSSRDCKACHEDIWAEWYGSHHQISYLNPEVKALSDDFRNKECQACHLSKQIAVTGFGKRSLPRSTRFDEGVGCITCHLDAQGRVMARNTDPSAPCEPVANEQFVSVELCASCHNQHNTTDQWRASHYAAEGTDCNDCHMPEVERKLFGGSGTRKGFDHVFRGAHDVDTLRAAGKLELSVEGGVAVMSLTNVGAGHNFPTEERHRAVDIMYRFVPKDGEAGEWQQAYRFRQPYRDEAGEDTQLPAGEKKTVKVEIPDGTAAVEARLWYRLKPYIDDDDPASTLLFEQRVEVP